MATKKRKSKRHNECLQHVLKPKHEKVSEKEKKEIKERYNIGVKQLPGILLTDPSLIGLDVKVSDIIKITRNTPHGGKSTFYREVIHESALDIE